MTQEFTTIRISDLPAATTLTGNEPLPVVQGNETVQTTVSALPEGITQDIVVYGTGAPFPHYRNLKAGSNINIVDGGSGGDLTISATSNGAPVGASYVTLGLDGTLTNERVLQVSAALTKTDGGAGGNVTIGTVAITGDVSVAANGTVSTIGNAKVTNAMLAGSITASNLVGTDIATVGTITTGTWSATTIAATKGGTGQTAYAVGDILYASTSTALSKLAAVATGSALISAGIGVAPAWGTIDLGTAIVSGTLAAARMPALTGDITTSAGAVATTLATVNSNVGSFGGSTAIPVITVNAKGLTTAVSTAAVVAPAGTLTGATLAAGVTASSLTSVGTIGTGVWQGTAVGILYGGTGQTTANAALNALLPSQGGNSGKILTTNGTDTSWSAVGAGNVVGPVSSTDNALVRFDGATGLLLQNSAAIVDDSGNISATNLSGTNTGNVTLAGENYINIAGQVITAAAVNLSGTNVTGNLGVSHLNSGTGASGSTFFRGDNTWAVPAGGGNVVGPVTSTDNAIARYDGATGEIIQDSAVVIDDSGNISGGVWQGTVIAPGFGGTGVANNAASTITISGNFGTTFTVTGTTALTLPTSGTVATHSDKLSAFAATTSAELRGVISDETGTGVAVFNDTPTLVTPVLGVATVTSVNKVAITAPATAATLTIADGSTLATSGAFSITLTATGATNVTLPTTGTLVNTAVTTLSSLASIGTITTGVWNGTIITSAYGGTGNGFTKFSGPTTSEKTFTLPNASATILTDNAAVTVAQGGTGIASGTSGGIPYFSSASTIASSAALTASRILLGGGAGVAPTIVGSLGTTTTVLHGNAAGAPTFGAVVLTSDVSGILPAANGGTANGFVAFSGPTTSTKTFTLPNASATILTDNAAVTVAQGGTGITSGTSGGIPYFSGTGTIASSGALTANRIVLGGGAGTTPGVLGSLGTTTTVLHGNAAGAPTFAAVSLTADVSGVLPEANGGTNQSTYAQGDILYASALNTLSKLAKDTNSTRYLSNTGTTNNPAWAQVDVSNGVNGHLPFANLTQGTARSVLGVTGNSTADVASIQGTANQVLVVNSGGTALAFGQVNVASSSAVTGIMAAANGGTGNGFFAVSGPTTSTKTFTFPDASATVLTSNDVTGSGSAVLATSPSLVTPALGAASATSIVVNTASQLATGGITASHEQFGTTAGTGTAVLGMFSTVAATQGEWQFYRSKNASIGSATVVANGDGLGKITWYGAQQTGTFSNQNPAAQIRAEVDATVTSGAGADMPGRIVFATTPDGSGSLADNLTLSSTGLLTAQSIKVVSATVPSEGIYSSAANTIDIAARSSRAVTITNPASGVNYFSFAGAAAGLPPAVVVAGGDTDITMQVSSKGAGAIQFTSNNLSNVILRLNHTASAVNWVAITGSATGVAPIVSVAGSDTNIDIELEAKGTGVLNCLSSYTNSTTGTANMIIASTGKIQRTTSMAKFKTDVEEVDVDRAISIIEELHPVWHRSLCPSDVEIHPKYSYYGLIAEEVAAVEPRLAFWDKEPLTKEVDGKIEYVIEDGRIKIGDEIVPVGVNYDRLAILMLVAYKKKFIEMQAEIDSLKTKIN